MADLHPTPTRLALLVVAVVAVVSVAACDPHVRQCKDGTQTGASNSGACSHHGGVAGGT
jgi:hypothetical protein